jgi:hypothetical protein
VNGVTIGRTKDITITVGDGCHAVLTALRGGLGMPALGDVVAVLASAWHVLSM